MTTVGADPHLASPDDLPAILQSNGLIRAVDAFPTGHVLALVTDRRRRVGLHETDYPRSSRLASGRSTRAGLPAAMTPGGTSSKTTAWIPITESRPMCTPGSTDT
jgi:hypothetical protein